MNKQTEPSEWAHKSSLQLTTETTWNYQDDLTEGFKS